MGAKGKGRPKASLKSGWIGNAWYSRRDDHQRGSTWQRVLTPCPGSIVLQGCLENLLDFQVQL